MGKKKQSEKACMLWINRASLKKIFFDQKLKCIFPPKLFIPHIILYLGETFNPLGKNNSFTRDRKNSAEFIYGISTGLLHALQ